jgi:hypothetical protein
MTTPQQALHAARAYVAREQSYSHVTGLLEDDLDYLVLTELEDAGGDWPLGPGPILVSKATGKVRDLGSAEGGNPRWDAMTEVQL